jgi:hypothetical protein
VEGTVHVASGHRCGPVGKHTAVGAKDLPHPPPPLTNALKASDMAAETLKKRESDGEGTEWREN